MLELRSQPHGVRPVVDQLLHDSYSRDGSQPDYRAGWRDGIAHAVKLIRRSEQAERLLLALHELAACDVDTIVCDVGEG